MPTQAPGQLIASRVAVMPDGAVAEVIITEVMRPYAVTCREVHARWHRDGAWSPWQLVTENASDISVSPDTSQGEPAALISAVIWTPAPTGSTAANYVAHRSVFFRLTASGPVPADL